MKGLESETEFMFDAIKRRDLWKRCKYKGDMVKVTN